MKSIKAVFVIFFIFSLLFANFSTGMALPPLPSSFYGKIKVGGWNVAVGTQVTAVINGVQYAYANSVLYNGETVYTLDVAGDDPATPAIEGGVTGDTIIFYFDGKPAQETALWQSGINVRFDLTGGSEWFYVFLPSIRQ